MLTKDNLLNCLKSPRTMYEIGLAYSCTPYPLPSSAIRHGRSWCEWEVA